MRCEIGKLVQDVIDMERQIIKRGMKQPTGNTANDITLTRGRKMVEACEGRNKPEREQKQACDADKSSRDEITDGKRKEMRNLDAYTGARI